MKQHFYTCLYVFTFLVAASIPDKVAAQCNCDDGSPATPISYTVKMDSSLLNTIVISFPKFDPSVGQLSCIVLKDTTSGVTKTTVWNKAPQDIKYRFLLNLSTNLTGPGFGVSSVASKIYGPDTLRIAGTAGDSLVYGPDTMFNNESHISSNSSDVTAYMGTGMVDFQFEVSGGVSSLQGGANFLSQISTYTWGVFNLTYYWCPNHILARNITSFTAIKKDHNIQLHWSVNNEEATNIYEIQISYDGQHFVRIGQTGSQHAGEGLTAEYDYEHVLKQTAAGKLYFRIQQKDLQGKTSYTPIRVVNVDANGPADVLLYPNPARQRSVSLQFDRMMNGQFAVDVVNAGGQVLLQRIIKANNTSQLSLELTNRITPGVYYLRARDMATQQTWLNKLLIQ